MCHKNRQRHKDDPKVPLEILVGKLMDMWRVNAASDATPESLFEIIKDKDCTAGLTENLRKEFSCGSFQSSTESFSCQEVDAAQMVIQFREGALQAVTKAVKDCLNEDETNFTYDEIKDSIVLRLNAMKLKLESFEINKLNEKCIWIYNNEAPLMIKLVVEEVTTEDFISGDNGQNCEYVIGNRKLPNCLYVYDSQSNPRVYSVDCKRFECPNDNTDQNHCKCF